MQAIESVIHRNRHLMVVKICIISFATVDLWGIDTVLYSNAVWIES